MRFLVDGCVGPTLAEWLRGAGHDVMEVEDLGADPGDQALLELAASSNRVMVTIDTDFGELIYRDYFSHAGLIRLPDVGVQQRIDFVAEIISLHGQELENRAIVTVSSGRIRVSSPPAN